MFPLFSSNLAAVRRHFTGKAIACRAITLLSLFRMSYSGTTYSERDLIIGYNSMKLVGINTLTVPYGNTNTLDTMRQPLQPLQDMCWVSVACQQLVVTDTTV